MKTLLTCFFSLATLLVTAQQRAQELADAENGFARYALQHDTKAAFLKFMDTAAVVFDKGVIQKAKAVWEAKKPTQGKLIWSPSFAVVSTAGDLGITTGPWEFKATADAKDTAIASGCFMTVWVKKDSQYKWVADIGITHNLKNPPSPEISSIELNHVERATYDAGRYMMSTEYNFINGYNSSGKEAYNVVADKDIHLLNPGQLPVHGVYSLDEALVNMSGKIQFEAAASGVSKDGDIGYVYGNATENGKKGNYLRIWRRIGRKWTLMMQTLTI